MEDSLADSPDTQEKASNTPASDNVSDNGKSQLQNNYIPFQKVLSGSEDTQQAKRAD